MSPQPVEVEVSDLSTDAFLLAALPAGRVDLTAGQAITLDVAMLGRRSAWVTRRLGRGYLCAFVVPLSPLEVERALGGGMNDVADQAGDELDRGAASRGEDDAKYPAAVRLLLAVTLAVAAWFMVVQIAHAL